MLDFISLGYSVVVYRAIDGRLDVDEGNGPG